MNLIVKLNDPTTRYQYNAYTTHDYEDRTHSPDRRVVFSDDLEEFLKELAAWVRENEEQG